jgi:hypothetical protein
VLTGPRNELAADVDFDVQRSAAATASPTGSRVLEKRRVETPASICSSTTRVNGSRLAASGQPLRMIQEFLGHADSKTTQIYAHYAPSEHEVQMVNDAFTPSADAVDQAPASQTPADVSE